VKMDFDGDVIWINDPGDGYGDNEYIYNTKVTKYGFLSGPARGTLYEGFILGPDGSGILNVKPSNVMGHVQVDMSILLEGTAYDGLYFYGDPGGSQRQFDDEGPPVLVQLPCDIQAGMIVSGAVAVEAAERTHPRGFALGQATPNPFNPSTTLSFSLGSDVHTKLALYNTTGQIVRTLVDEPQTAGTYRVRWDGRDDAGHGVSAGVYVCVLEAGAFTQTRTMALVK
jgi:hypothetical protein